ncbi:MAG TPA: hypothetical protein VJX66_31940 [Amycolatopsis sp.]|nr:hypothetical protein [Amycolatopsis sp.]
MTTATIEVDEDVAEGHPRRVVLFTIAVLLPADFNDVDVAEIVPEAILVDGGQSLTDFIETRVQDARLVLT